MLYTQDLEELIFHRHEMFLSDELIIISGYVGPKPVKRLGTLPLRSKIVYGMYGSEGIEEDLHNSLIKLQNEFSNVSIFYSQLPVHSKCYTWMHKREIVHALIGSANFSTNGLTTPYREVLAETTRDTFSPLNEYIKKILNNSVSCLEVDLSEVMAAAPISSTKICLLSLLGRDGEVQNVAGLNWGQGTGNHTTINDSYIKIRIQDIKNFPNLFPQKLNYPIISAGRGKMHRHNDSFDIIWDDGTTMEGIFFGNQVISGVLYPKQVGSFPAYSEMGIYFRKRLGIPLGQPVRRYHLERYGRLDVGISMIGERVYKFDFSVP